MKYLRFALIVLLAVATMALPVAGQKGKKKKANAASEETYYKLLKFDAPEGAVLEGGALEVMPDGRVALGTRRGEIWMIENAYDPDPTRAKFTRFAHGLHEVLGLAYKDGWL